MEKWYARLFVYGSIPLRFLWTFFAEQKQALIFAWIEIKYPEEQVAQVLQIAKIRREARGAKRR